MLIPTVELIPYQQLLQAPSIPTHLHLDVILPRVVHGVPYPQCHTSEKGNHYTLRRCWVGCGMPNHHHHPLLTPTVAAAITTQPTRCYKGAIPLASCLVRHVGQCVGTMSVDSLAVFRLGPNRPAGERRKPRSLFVYIFSGLRCHEGIPVASKSYKRAPAALRSLLRGLEQRSTC